MLKSKIVGTALAALLVLTSTNVFAGDLVLTPAPKSSVAPVAVWLIFGCASGIILAAAIASAKYNRQLTQREAVTCGLLFLLNTSAR